MTNLSKILEFNRSFVENKDYETYLTDKFPDKKMVIITCMDARLVELLPKAMNLRNGDAKIIKNAGAIITMPFGNVMRSVLVAIYELGAREVFVVGHHGCGMTGIDPEKVIQKAVDWGISEDVIDTLKNSGINLNRWLTGFDSVHEGVTNSVEIIRKHPLLPPGIPVHGMIMDPKTGKLEVVADGYSGPQLD